MAELWQIHKGRNLEYDNKWQEAADYWDSIGHKEDAKTCRVIVESNNAGDEFRRLNEICPICSIVSLREVINCPNCNVIKSKANKIS